MKYITLLLALVLVACAQSANKPSNNANPAEEFKDNPVACTMDAMQCTDGSWVGRSGPSCEFACAPAAAENQQ